MYAWILADYAASDVDVARVVKMLLIHDIVEVDAGDSPIHGSPDNGQAEREQRAAERLFGLLPAAQSEELASLWQEFEAEQSGDSQFAKALDRFQPLLANILTGGGTWVDSGVGPEQVLERYGPAIQTGRTGAVGARAGVGYVALQSVSRLVLGSGAVAMRYEPRR
jgi:putative hydrolase of HD superfamily